jgi:hypothetical protein
VAEEAYAAGLLSDDDWAAYGVMGMEERDDFVRAVVDERLVLLGYNPLGLEDSVIDATLVEGSYFVAHAYSWTEFEIDPGTREMTVTTYGIDPSDGAELPGVSAGNLAPVPIVLSRFRVTPRAVPPSPPPPPPPPPVLCWIRASSGGVEGMVVVLAMAGLLAAALAGRAGFRRGDAGVR